MAEIVVNNPEQLQAKPLAGQVRIGQVRTVAGYAALTVAATALVAVGAHATVPLFFTPVPITLQTLAVLFLGLSMGPRWAFATLSLYLLEGAAGLPVFSPFGPGGVMQLLGPTGGYLLAYPFAAAAAGFLYRLLSERVAPRIGPRFAPRFALRFAGARLTVAAISALVATTLILAAGAAWLGAWTHQPAPIVLAQGVIPFLPGDFLKACLAAAAVAAIHRVRRPATASSGD